MDHESAGVPWGLKRTARRDVSARLGKDVADLVVARGDVESPVMAGSLPVTRWEARHRLSVGAHAVTVDRALLEQGVAADAATVLVSDVVFAAIRPSRDALVTVARLRHRDRLRRALWLSRMAQRLYYAEPDWKTSDVPVEGGFGMDVTRCAAANCFDSLGMAEFCQRVICDRDARDAAHRGIDFERKGTLAGGASRCDRRYHDRSVGAG